MLENIPTPRVGPVERAVQEEVNEGDLRVFVVEYMRAVAR